MLLRLEGLSKSYPGVRANDDISFDIGVAEIHALLGENGAGKSTLVKMIYGLVKPDRGRMLLSQNPFAPREPREARAAGIGMVFQHFSLFEALSVAENIALGMDHPPSMRALGEKIIEVSERYGLPLDPNRPIYSLSAGERQRVEIIRCLLQNPRLLIMDEPTSVLTPQEVDVLFATLRKLRENGTSILYISHKLDEIRALCDTATILRHGQKVATCTPSETTVQDLAEMMVGSSFDVAQRQEKSLGDVLLSVKNLSSRASDIGGISIQDISFEVRAGEILGIGGVAGNGQDELLALLSGERMAQPDMIAFQSTPVAHLNASDRRLLGINSAPEDRLGHAAAPDMSLVENVAITAVERKSLVKNGLLNWAKATDYAKEIVAAFDVRTPHTQSAARSLSGGNLQKFVMGREILQIPRVLIVNQPTWGVDAAAAAFIRQAILNLAQKGSAIIVISQDLDELLEISDRFAALNAGKLSDIRETGELSMQDIGAMMGGAERREVFA